MANKKAKTEQEAKAPETSTPEPQAGQEPSAEQTGDDPESRENTEPGAGAEDGAGEDTDTENGEDAPEKPLPKVLTALRPILYLARQYKAGDPLPVNNTEMVEAWIAAGSAEWREKKGGRFFP